MYMNLPGTQSNSGTFRRRPHDNYTASQASIRSNSEIKDNNFSGTDIK